MNYLLTLYSFLSADEGFNMYRRPPIYKQQGTNDPLKLEAVMKYNFEATHF